MAAQPDDIITLARARQAFAGATFNTADLTLSASEDITLQLILTACSQAAKRVCNRSFVQTTWDEVYPRQEFPILLRNFPVISVSFMRDTPTAVLTIQQTTTTTNQYATAEILSTGLRLKRIASGTTTTVTAGLDFAGNATLTALAAAVVALGAGWTAAALSPYGLFPSADLYISSQNLAPFDVRSAAAYVPMHVSTYAQLAPHPPTGHLQLPNELSDHPTLYPSTSLRVQYSAGYATFPEDLQAAIATWSAAIMYQLKRDPVSGNIFAAGVGASYRNLIALMPDITRGILSLYKNRPI